MKKSVFYIVFIGFIGCSCNKPAYIPTDLINLTNNKSDSNDNEPLLKQIKVLTYNIHFCNPPSKPGTYDIQGIADVINRINPDIAVLQEVDKNTGYNNCFLDQSEELRKLTKMNKQFFSERTRYKGFFGSMILSKYPLKNPNVYPLVKLDPTYAQRALGSIIVDLPGVDSILVSTTQLEVFSPENRYEQLKEILNILPLTGETPVIIGGDFNTRPTDTKFFGLFDEYFTLTCSGIDCPSTYDNPSQVIAIDHIGFYPKNAFIVKSHEVLSNEKASDHFPLVSVLEFNR